MNHKMNRKAAREAALQILFAAEFQPGELTLDIPDDAEAGKKDPNMDTVYCHTIVAGVKKQVTNIDALIQKFLKKWKVSRLDVVDRSILRLAVWELKYSEEPLAPSIVINEAVTMAKTYGSDTSYKLINGILDSIVKDSK